MNTSNVSSATDSASAVNIAKKFLVEPIKENLAASMFALGVLLVFIGAIFGDMLDKIEYIPNGTGAGILSLGTGILGAGVFASIMKSAQFSKLFQDHISHVLYSPEKCSELDLVKHWKNITQALISKTLPAAHREAPTIIYDQLMAPGVDYHFLEYEAYYHVLRVDGSVATVENTVVTTIVVSPSSEKAPLKQTIKTDIADGFELRSLMINQRKIAPDGLYTVDPLDSTLFRLNLDLAPYATGGNKNEGRTLKFERTSCWRQDLRREPYIRADVSRFIKGASVHVKLCSHPDQTLRYFFKGFGVGQEMDEQGSAVGDGYQRHVLAGPNSLLLPGQGYIILLQIEEKSMQSTETI